MTRAIRRRSAPDDEEGSDSLCDLDENVHLLEHYGDSAGFLADIVPDQLYDRTQKSLTYVKKAKKVSRNLDPSDSEDEVDRDLLGRDPSADREDPPKKLPVLCSDGLMRLLPRESVEGGDSASSRDLSEFSGDLEDADDESGRPEERNAQLPDANSEINSGNCRKVFSSIALSIMADPQSNLGSLGVIFNAIMREDDLDVKEVGIVVLMKVFKDIIPGYRIKDPQEDDDSRALSREVRILRQYEIALLHYYKKYLQTLDRMHKNGNYWSILKTVMRCYGELLTNLSYFNYRTNLIASLTSRLNCTEPAGIDYVCYKALYTLFRENQRSDAISEAVRLIARSIKNARRVNPLCIKVLSGLQLDNYGGQSKEEDKPTKPAKGDKIHLSAKMRKQMKMRATIERDLKAHNEEIEAKRTEREMSEIIKCIFVIYFRVLKVNREPELLLVAFEGLSRSVRLLHRKDPSSALSLMPTWLLRTCPDNF